MTKDKQQDPEPFVPDVRPGQNQPEVGSTNTNANEAVREETYANAEDQTPQPAEVHPDWVPEDGTGKNPETGEPVVKDRSLPNPALASASSPETADTAPTDEDE